MLLNTYKNNPQPFWHQELVSWKVLFPRIGAGRWFRDDSSALHLLRALSWELGTPGSARDGPSE